MSGGKEVDLIRTLVIFITRTFRSIPRTLNLEIGDGRRATIIFVFRFFFLFDDRVPAHLSSEGGVVREIHW